MSLVSVYLACIGLCAVKYYCHLMVVLYSWFLICEDSQRVVAALLKQMSKLHHTVHVIYVISLQR